MRASYSGTLFDAHDTSAIFGLPDLNGADYRLRIVFDPDAPGVDRSIGDFWDYASGGSSTGFASPIRAAHLTINGRTVSVPGRDAKSALAEVSGGIGDTPGFVSQGLTRQSIVGNIYDSKTIGTGVHGPAGSFVPDLDAAIPLTMLLPGGDVSGGATFSFGSCIYEAGECAATLTDAFGNMTASSFEIAPIPGPLGLALLPSGLALLVLVAHRRSTTTA
ncbi:MAG TPA: hypothetical protein VFN28_05370 [Amaricoccus sp.]|nr:hypothetical protein [Amaricoccus sp.]